MTGGWAWLAGLLLALGPTGWWIDARLDSADAAYRRLVPMDWLGDTPDSLWIVFHRRDAWLMAVYLPPDAEEMRWAKAFPAAVSGEFERLLPQLEVPRLLLQADVYRQGDGLVDLGSLPVDSAEILYNALLDAHFDLASRRGEPWTSDLATRANDAMARVPPEHRTEAYRGAVIDFASHLLSMAGEIARQSRRHTRQRLCAVLDRPATLFGSWHRAFGDGRFPGHWQQPKDPESGRPGDWVTTPDVLRRADKRWVVEEILGADWSGDAAVDFALFCRSDAGLTQRSRRTGEIDRRAGSLTLAR